MKRKFTLVLRTIAILGALAVSTTASAQDVKLPEIEFGRYHALVIGNNDYQHLRNLTTAVGDADAVAKLLEKKYGFQVTKLTNATRRDIAGALNRLRQTLTERDNLLIYYAGHGVLDEEAGAGYWQPVDARSDDDTDWFSNTRLTNYLRAMSAQHVMVVADSCYSGNLTRVATSTVRSGAERTAWMQRMNQKRSRTALTSGGLEPVLDQGGGGHSVFARAFLTALDESPDVLFGEELFDRVKGVVVANAEQTPEYSDIRHTGHEKGDFLFVPLDINVSLTVKIPPREQADREALFWETIKNSDDPAMFEAYLERYPEGEFARIAKLMFEAVTKAKEQQTALVGPPKPEIEIEIDPIEAEYVAVKNANVRAEPTVRSAKVATLQRGASVHVAGKVKGQNWYLVERDDKPLGYVYGALLKEPEPPKQEDFLNRLRKVISKHKQAEDTKTALLTPKTPAWDPNATSVENLAAKMFDDVCYRTRSDRQAIELKARNFGWEAIDREATIRAGFDRAWQMPAPGGSTLMVFFDPSGPKCCVSAFPARRRFLAAAIRTRHGLGQPSERRVGAKQVLAYGPRDNHQITLDFEEVPDRGTFASTCYTRR